MVLHGSAWLFLTLGSAAQSPGSARLSLALLDSWIGTVLFFFLSICCCGLFVDEVFVFFFHSLTRINPIDALLLLTRTPTLVPAVSFFSSLTRSSSRRSGALSRILLLLHTTRHSLTRSLTVTRCCHIGSERSTFPLFERSIHRFHPSFPSACSRSLR